MARKIVSAGTWHRSHEYERCSPADAPLSDTLDIDEAAFRSTMAMFASGVVVVAADVDNSAVGMTVQAFASLSINPPLVIFCPSRCSTSWPLIADAGYCAISILANHHEALARHFAVSGADKFTLGSWRRGLSTGAPILDDAIGWIEARIDNIHAGGDHYIVVARVLSLGNTVQSNNPYPGYPLVFHCGEFWTLSHG